MMERIHWVILSLCVVVIAAIVGSAFAQDNPAQGEYGDLKKFNSSQELREYLEEHVQMVGNGYQGYPDKYTGIVEESGVPASTPAPTADDASQRTGTESDYSTTNVQVEGVDEADFVKNDGRYIYVLSGSTLVIADAYPADDAGIISETELTGEPVEMFINGDRLVVFSTQMEETYYTPQGSAAPVPYWRHVTHAYVYSLDDREDPEVVREISFSGTYYDARMIGDYIYVLTSESVMWYGNDFPLPEVRDGESQAVYPDVYYPIVPHRNYVYHTLASFNIENDRTPEAETFLLGYASTLYVSTDNLYIGYQKQSPVYAEPMPVSDAPVSIAPDTQPQNQDSTLIHKFAIKNGEIEYRAMGDVPGHLLNQFSLDEYQGYLRVATTVQGWDRSSSVQYNNVYVLDGEMKTVGELENIAPDEQIYATRFIGDRLYMVTFKRVDPFFVIDLSNPEQPGILGKLKIPGYSDYLHPYDENHIIGIGKETAENEWGGVSTEGLKIALFNVSDVNNPTQVDKVEIGESGTDSAALHDHKAFLFDRSKDGLLVIPVQEIRRENITGGKYQSYNLKTWQGAYVFSVSPADGFILKGMVTHQDNDSSYYWDSPATVLRSLYINDALYTISRQSIIISDLDNVSERIGEIELPYQQDYWPYYRTW